MILLFLIFLVMAAYVYRLVDWQIINSEYYKLRATSSNVYFINTGPIRGEILDRDGKGLVINDTGYKVVLDRLLIDKSEENKTIVTLAQLLEKLGSNWIDILPIKIEHGKYEFLENQDSEVDTFKKVLKLPSDISASEAMEKLVEKYKAEDFNPVEQRIICSVKYNMEKTGAYFSKSTPYVFSESVDKNVVIVISENNSDLRGVRIQTSLIRKYPDGEIAPHILGYTGFMSAEEYEKYKGEYSLDSIIGKAGIENVFEGFLRGIGGKRMVQVSKDGGVIGTSEKKPAVSGNTVHLTLSSKVQQAANKALAENIEQLKKKGVSDCTSGAAVMIDVKDFSILAAATYPNYDLNKFMQDKSYYSQLYKDKSTPLLNKAFSGAYTPGSVYKPLVACAALESGNITPSEKIYCGGSFNYYHGYRLRCMGVHGPLGLVNALAKSCNVYFAELGRRIGDEILAEWANKFGIGVPTGVEIGESKGTVAGRAHSEAVGAHWYESGSSQAAIGQSDNMITPVQLATYAATIANGGKRYKTHLLQKITDYSRSEVVKQYEPELVEDLGLKEETINTLKAGMREVVLSGTARDFANYPVPIAAKTGTAQNNGNDHTTFVCFAPYDDPQIAIAVVIEHGKYGTASKNVARSMLNAYFGIE